jgi:hypothetical protein
VRYRLHAAAASAVLICAIWLSSGTLSPYSANFVPLVIEPCHYLVNIDHPHHTAPFYLLAGAPPKYWAFSVVLRRMLYPVLAYPFVRAFGFLVGGLLCNVFITLAALFAFGQFTRRHFGERAAIAVIWLVATYPGITYWAGLPYAYAAIVPASLLAAMCLYAIDRAERVREVVLAAMALGLIFLAYDLIPFFVPAMVLVLLARRKPLWAVPAVITALVPALIVAGLLSWLDIAAVNSNTATYATIVNAYLHPEVGRLWLGYLARLPLVLAANFFDSNFFFLPLLAVVALLLCRGCIGRVEGAILLSVMAVFLVNNAAPPYYGWQLRGYWIARLYQPLFVALLLCIARAVRDAPRQKLMRAAIVVTVIANAAVGFGPVMRNPLAFYLDYRFYRHAEPSTFAELLAIYGRRPLGLCLVAHDLDERPLTSMSTARLPFAFRPPPASR